MKFKFNDKVIVKTDGFYGGAVGNVIKFYPSEQYSNKYKVRLEHGITQEYREKELEFYKPYHSKGPGGA